MKWLITGGCGFIGSALVRKLSAKPDDSVRILDNLSIGRIENLLLTKPTRVFENSHSIPKLGTDAVDIVIGDICDLETYRRAAAGCDVIVHLAANTGVMQSIDNPLWDCTTNVVGTVNGLEAARSNGIKRFVLASSGAPLADGSPPFDEEQIARPNSPYGASKRSGELYCRAYTRSFGLDTVALRFSNVYGPGSGHKGSVVAAFLKQALAGRPMVIYGDGYQTRDFIYLMDLIEALTLAVLRSGISGEVFHIATGVETRVLDLAAAIKSALARAGLPDIAIAHEEARAGDVDRNFANIDKAKHLLGWEPRTPLIQGIEATVQWFAKSQSPY